ncbi:MAG TPA: S8 family serine peptidase [Chthoniobacteraceae bacterium]|jgi:subtilisin family serine protease|nr:S8 family serine peptidase [Chthoniobacteraceae bacterium]
MPTIRLGRKDEPSIELTKSTDLLAVRTRSTRSLRAGPVPAAAADELSDGHLVVAFPEAGVEVYRLPVQRGARSLVDRKAALQAAPDVRFAGGVFTDAGGEPVLYTENLFIKFHDQVAPETCREVLREAGLTIKREVTYALNSYFAAAPEGIGEKIFDLATGLLQREDVEFCHPELLWRRVRRAIAPQQWHLRTTSVDGVNVAASANVELAHGLTQGEGIVIAIIDDGVDVDHPEFASAGKIVAPRDVTLGTDNPRPKDPFSSEPDNHGTACAGVACADGVAGASGVAPKAKLMPIRLMSGLGSQQEADAFAWAVDHGADVISCSWGPPDGPWFRPNDPSHANVFPLPASTRLALNHATDAGRGGKGCVILFAAGNGNESVDNDGYSSYERVIAVAASNDRGKRCVYSDFGNAVWCSFPSSDFAFQPENRPEPLTPGIWTTDRHGAAGYNSGRVDLGDAAGNYTNSFGGTSSAAPGAAGVAALVLSRNPELRWQEVRDILRRACDRIDPQGGQYNAQGRSRFYGFGRLNAESAVQLAAPSARRALRVSRTVNEPLPDLQTVEVTLEVNETAPAESVAFSVDIKHTYIGDLRVTLAPPAELGMRDLVLHDRAGNSARNLQRTFDALVVPAFAAFKGRSAKGRWTLRVQDTALRDEGVLRQCALELVLAEPAPRHAAPAPRAVRRPGSRPARAARK